MNERNAEIRDRLGDFLTKRREQKVMQNLFEATAEGLDEVTAEHLAGSDDIINNLVKDGKITAQHRVDDYGIAYTAYRLPTLEEANK